MIIKTSGFPEFEIEDEVLDIYPYITSIIKMGEGSSLIMLMVLSDTPFYTVEKMFEYLGGGDGCYFVDMPTRYVLLMVSTEDGASASTEPMADDTSMSLDELQQFILQLAAYYGCSVTYANYDVLYATTDENGNAQITDRLAYVGDTSEPITLSAPSSAFQLIADFVRLSIDDSELMNSTTLLEKIKSISGMNPDIIAEKSSPSEECIALLNGVHESNFYNDEVTKIKSYFFKDDVWLVSVDLPNVIEMGKNVFDGCSALVNVSLPNLTTSGGNDFRNCTSLETINLPNYVECESFTSGLFTGCTALKNINVPKLTDVSQSMFDDCTSLEKLVLPSVTYLSNACFERCYNLTCIDFYQKVELSAKFPITDCGLKHLIFRNETMSVDSNMSSSTFYGTPIADGTGYIYVPRSLVDSYKTHNKWSPYANQFRAIEDYTVDGTIMGEMDWNKLGITFTN